MSEWISVNERLPANSDPVLVCNGAYRTLGRCEWTRHGQRTWSDGDGFTLFTHWMPLPEPPEKPKPEAKP